jgi:preprotein translocase subunit SecD
MTQNTSGCMEQLIGILVIVAAVLFGGVAGTVSPPSTPAAAQPTLQIVLDVPADATDTQIASALQIVQSRLISLDTAGLIPAGSDARRDGRSIVVRFAEGTFRTDAITQALSTVGLLELVDVTTVPANEVGALNNQIIRTSAAPDRKAAVSDQVYPTIITNADIESAEAIKSSNNDRWVVNVKLKPEAGEKFGAFTAAHIGKPLAIVIDGRVISAPVIQSRIAAEVQIAGNYTEMQAKTLAIQFTRAPLPFALTLASVEAIK